jgi:hypothetical protein
MTMRKVGVSSYGNVSISHRVVRIISAICILRLQEKTIHIEKKFVPQRMRSRPWQQLVICVNRLSIALCQSIRGAWPGLAGVPTGGNLRNCPRRVANRRGASRPRFCGECGEGKEAIGTATTMPQQIRVRIPLGRFISFLSPACLPDRNDPFLFLPSQ